MLSSLRLFCSGLAMGAADVTPGISGGTMALILGLYENLIESIRSLRKLSSWQFLVPLLLGMASAILALSSVVHEVLKNPEWRAGLYSLFLGLVLASVVILSRQIKRWSPFLIGVFFTGALAAWLLTDSHTPSSPDKGSFLTGSYFDINVMGGGMLAIMAMLLPGISGSYVLNILGLYAPAMGALAGLLGALKALSFDSAFYAALAFLGSMLVGILVGAALFSHMIAWLLRHYHAQTVALLTGFMIGALKTVWPFWGTPEGSLIGSLTPILPDVLSIQMALSLTAFAGGFLLVLGLESLTYQGET